MRNEKQLTKPELVARINDLLATNSGKLGKYQRNYSLYNQTPGQDLKSKNPMPVGYVDDVYSEDSEVPKLNIIKSAIDAVVSKMATAHCRPFVNTVKGSFKTIQICKQLQIFLDYYYEEQNVQTKIVNALRNACAFDTGYVYIDEVDGSIKNIAPWNVYTRPTENEDFKSVYIEFPNISLDELRDEDYELLTKQEKNYLYTSLGYFYDSRTKTKATLINRQIREIKQVKFSEIPIVPIYYTNPIVGNTTLSISDMLRGIQKEIDELMTRISDASILNPGLTYFVSNASNIKVGQLNNKIGNIVQYNSANGSNPVVTSTPNFIGDQYISLLNDLIEKAYNMVGISQLSAQGKKPAGLDSGVALATQNDIESDRFQVLLDQYINTFTAIAKKAIKIFKSDKTIIKPNRYNLRLTWGEIEEEWDKMRIQFSSADSLSKDPSEKLKQLQTLAQAGIIPATQIASLIEIPDINRGYSVANNAFNATMTLIDQCIYEDKYEVPEYVPFQMLKEQIVNMELSLRSASTDGSNDKDIKKLQKYFEKIEETEHELTDGIQEQATNQDVALNNAYTDMNGPQSAEQEGKATPYETGAANDGELAETT